MAVLRGIGREVGVIRFPFCVEAFQVRSIKSCLGNFRFYPFALHAVLGKNERQPVVETYRLVNCS